MKQIYAVLLAMLLAGPWYPVYAQSQDEITVRQIGLRFAYYHNGRQMSKNELLYVLDGNPEANKELRTGQRNKMPATVLSYAGSLLLGYPVTAHLTGKHPSWALAGIGAGLLVLSLPFKGAVMKREQYAVHHYNTGTRQASSQIPSLRFGYDLSGASLKVSF